MRSVFASVASSHRVWAALATLSLAACRSGGGPGAEPAAKPTNDPATLAARNALANEQSLDVRTISERAIAVPALTVAATDTNLTPLGYGLADMLLTDLARSAQVIVVERSQMNALLREMKMVQSGQVDTSSAPRVGKLLGARRLVVGALVDRGGGELGVETRLVNTVDGSIGGAISARAPLASIFDAEKALAYRIFTEMGVTLTPAERNAIEQRPTANINAFLAYSKGVRDEAFGQYASAAANFRAATVADPSFAPAKARLDNVQTIAQTTPTAPTTVVEVKPVEAKTVTTTSVANTNTPAATTSSAAPPASSGAANLAAGSINPSPAGSLGTTTGTTGSSTTSSTTQQQQQQDRGAQAQRQPVIATVVINIKQLP